MTMVDPYLNGARFGRATCEPPRLLLARPEAHQLLHHGLEADGHEDGLAGHHRDPHQLVRRHQVFKAQLQLGLGLELVVGGGGGGGGERSTVQRHNTPAADAGNL